MLLEKFTKINVSDFLLGKVQQNLEKYFNQFAGVLFLKGELKKNVTITTSGAEIAHSLNSETNGYLIFKQDSGANIWMVSGDRDSITLESSATVVVDLWIF